MDSTNIIYDFEPLWDTWRSSDLLGLGSTSRVYKISRREFGKEFTSALKLITIPSDIHILELKKSNSNNSLEYKIDYIHNLVRNIINEITLLYELKGHSNIISYEDHMIKKISDDNWLIFIKMELATPLNIYFSENKFTVRKTIKLGIDMCSALETSHFRNIIHGDIRESNIFVSKNETFKLGNFNVSNDKNTPDYVQKKIGTLNYVPPEIIAGSKYTYLSDIYTLGIVLYKLLNNGKFPMNDTPITCENYFKKLSNAKFKPPINSFKELSEILSKACSFNPNDRYQKAEEFKDDLIKLTQINKKSKGVLSKTLENNLNDIKDLNDENDNKSFTWRGVVYKKH
ncbi:MAG: protein kinase [Clostridiales bacterium]